MFLALERQKLRYTVGESVAFLAMLLCDFSRVAHAVRYNDLSYCGYRYSYTVGVSQYFFMGKRNQPLLHGRG